MDDGPPSVYIVRGLFRAPLVATRMEELYLDLLKSLSLDHRRRDPVRSGALGWVSTGERHIGRPLTKSAHDWQSLSATHVAVVLRCLLNTIRLATSPGEVASVLRLFFKFLVWRLTGSLGVEQDETLRLQGVTHVIALGTGELLVPQEIYWD